MGLLLSGQHLSKTYGTRTLFTDITLGLYEGEKCGMFGPNGAGKSTFLKILAAVEHPDEGTVERRRGVRVGYLAQEDKFTKETVREELLTSIASQQGDMIEHETRVAIVLSKVGFDEQDVLISTLSGGWRKRLALARELLKDPELLLLDEPTNHLDLEGILWLEEILKESTFAYVVVTHDRYFLENVTNRVIEINRMYGEGFLSVPGTYSDFLERRDVVLEAQAKEQQAMQNKAKGEIAWLRRGPKARRTKSKSRIEDAHELLGNLADVKERNAAVNAEKAGVEFAATGRKTNKLLTAHQVTKSMGNRLLIDKINLVLSPGMKLGVLGPNGSGKSTLLKVLTNRLAPDAGTVKEAVDLKIVFFDQQRQQLEKSLLLKEALSPGTDSVVFNGELIHVSSWARRFLFRYEQLDRPVGELSGGEQARVLIAKLMLSAADVLVLDEPTNDLDIPTLEVLEENLVDFPGAMVLVTHDRYMLDRLSTEILGLDGFGGHSIVTDYEQYARWAETGRKTREAAARAAASNASKSDAKPAEPKKKAATKRLSYMEQREWDTMENSIMEAEGNVLKWQKAMEDPKVIADRIKFPEACDEAHKAQEKVAKLYARWEMLQAKFEG